MPIFQYAYIKCIERTLHQINDRDDSSNHEQGQNKNKTPSHSVKSPIEVVSKGKTDSRSNNKPDIEMVRFIEEDFDKHSYLFKHINEDVYGSGINQVKVFRHHPSRIPFDYKSK